MSPGEIYLLEKAGFQSDEIFYIGNNVSEDEFRFCIDRDITVSVDSLSQLETYSRMNRGGCVAVRFKSRRRRGPLRQGHNGRQETKFGVEPKYCREVKEILEKYDMKLVGINQHIGSLFLDPAPYAAAAGEPARHGGGEFPRA